MTSILYEATPKSLRGAIGNTLAIMFSVGLMSGFTLCSLVNTGSITWRNYYVVILCIAGVDFLLQVLYLGRDLSVIYMFKEKQSETRIRHALGSYLSEQAADELYFEQREGHKANLKA